MQDCSLENWRAGAAWMPSISSSSTTIATTAALAFVFLETLTSLGISQAANTAGGASARVMGAAAAAVFESFLAARGAAAAADLLLSFCLPALPPRSLPLDRGRSLRCFCVAEEDAADDVLADDDAGVALPLCLPLALPACPLLSRMCRYLHLSPAKHPLGVLKKRQAGFAAPLALPGFGVLPPVPAWGAGKAACSLV